MKFPFTKMHGLGNDFVVFDFTRRSFNLSAATARQIANRHLGIGCDQILIVEPSSRPEIDFKYRIFNADGGEVGQCGNGARCFALFVHDQGLTEKTQLNVATLSGDLQLRIDTRNRQITVDMGVPEFAPNRIPLLADQQQALYRTELAGETIEFSALSIGNPHAVIVVSDINSGVVERLGPLLESHAFFPERANIGFMQIEDRETIRLRVFERGVGETNACGSGACAAVVSGINAGQLEQAVTARLRGGDLSISWAGAEQTVMMTGPAQTVFHGEIEL
ncbi:MAG: diaminopimelate epimerase [Gammaproteobacteria bacterium]|nr:diaminopimelate epimerase [Gammaproteobacteria bacterium]